MTGKTKAKTTAERIPETCTDIVLIEMYDEFITSWWRHSEKCSSRLMVQLYLFNSSSLVVQTLTRSSDVTLTYDGDLESDVHDGT